MNSSRLLIPILLGSLALGCIPEKRIVWSPDGSRAAVSTGETVFFIDGQGRVLPPRLEGKSARGAWYKDGRRLAVVSAREAGGWAEIASIFDVAQLERIRLESELLRQRALAHEGDWNKFDVDPQQRLSPGDELAVVMYTRDKNADGLAAKLGDEWKELEKATASVWSLRVLDWKDDKPDPGRTLLQTLDEVYQPRVAPSGKNISLLMAPDSGNGELALFVISGEGGQTRPVATNVAAGYDWSADSRSLVYIHAPPKSANDQGVQLGSLATVVVSDGEGRLLPEWAENADRVGVLFSPLMQTRWLSDGRILFSSVEVTLPTTTRDMPRNWSLFVLDPRMPATVTRALPRDFPEPLDAGLPMFELSPDESSVLLPGPKGRVYLYEFASGKCAVIQGEEDPDGKMRSLPSWRGPGEVCCVVPRAASADSKTPASIVLWKDGKSRELSGDWPEAMKEGWLVGG